MRLDFAYEATPRDRFAKGSVEYWLKAHIVIVSDILCEGSDRDAHPRGPERRLRTSFEKDWIETRTHIVIVLDIP